jgi:tetratricopeptide (TPR) repeat protein
MFPPAEPRPEESAYDSAIDRAFRTARRLTRRWDEDQGRLARGLSWVREKKGLLSELSPAQSRTILPWIRVEILLQLSFEVRHRDPARMLDLARHAQEVADRIETAPYGPEFLVDLRTRAWAELANALRVNELYRQAEATLLQARALLERGSGDLLLQARIDDIEGSLRKDQRLYREAGALMDEAHGTYLKIGERHLAGRVLIKKGLCLRLAGRPSEAVQVLREALDLLDGGLDPKLVASARHNLLDSLVDAGRLAEAEQVLFESDLRQAFAEEPQSLLRLCWVEGKLLARRGRLADATRVLAEVRAGFREQGLHYVAAVAGADQTALLLRQISKRRPICSRWISGGRSPAWGFTRRRSGLSGFWRPPAAAASRHRSWRRGWAVFWTTPLATGASASTLCAPSDLSRMTGRLLQGGRRRFSARGAM